MTSGSFAADFRLECAGIFRPRLKSEQEAADKLAGRQDRMLRSLLAVLSPGDSVEFRFRGGGGERLSWEIRGRTCRQTAEDAIQAATTLIPSFSTIASAVGEQYRFEPTPWADEGSNDGMAFRGALAPETADVLLPHPGRTLGFGLAASEVESDRSRIVVPVFHAKRGFAFPSLAAVIAGAPVSLSCTVEVSPFMLTPSERRLVKKAFDHLVAEAESTKRTPGAAEDAEGSLSGCKETLAQWLTSGAGYRIQAELTSPVPLSPTLRGLVANDLFPQNSAAAQPVGAEAPAPPQCSLDLSNSIPMRGTLPILFPDLDTLQRDDATQLYNRRRPKLPATGMRIGHILEAGLRTDVNADAAHRDRHTYIIGATGTGKSTLLFNCILQDILAGNGVCLIDPHGDLYEQLLHAIPASRKNDVILFNPCETDAVPGINFLEVVSEKTRTFEVNFVVNEFVKMLDRIYDLRVTGGPMFETYFRNALLLLIDSSLRGHTLAELPAIFEDKAFRDHLKKHCKNQYAINFWTRQAEKAGGECSLQNIAPYITSKLNLLIQSALLRPIIGQSRSTIDFRAVMDRRQILLVNLSKGQLGELDMQLLGMIIIGKIFSSAMARSAQRQNRRQPFHLYVDEFQNFTTDTAASLLSEARKFGLCVTLANQNLAQLKANAGKQNLLDAILGNVGSFILFRLGAPDAETMQVYTRPQFNYEDLQNLPNFHALARLQTANGPTIPFVFKTEAPAAIAQPSRVLNAIRKRQRLYRTPREMVERAILDRQNVEMASLPTPDQLQALVSVSMKGGEMGKKADEASRALEEKMGRLQLLTLLRLREANLQLAEENASSGKIPTRQREVVRGRNGKAREKKARGGHKAMGLSKPAAKTKAFKKAAAYVH